MSYAIMNAKKILKGCLKQKTFSDKLRYLKYAYIGYKNGIISFRIDRFAENCVRDYNLDTEFSEEEKDWFYQRGYYSYQAGFCGMNRENYKNFISEFDFYAPRTYIDRKFVKLFDHKLQTWYLLQPFAKNLPEHFFYIKDKRIFLLGNTVDIGYKKFFVEDIFRLLESKKVLAAKACTGGHSRGFYKFELREGQFFLNRKISSREEFKNLLENFDDYLITEYCLPGKFFRDLIGAENIAAIRAYLINDPEDGAQLTGIYVRLTTKAGEFAVDYEGTIYCGIDMSGKLFSPILRKGSDSVYLSEKIEKHPDTGATIAGNVLPDFDDLKKLLSGICNYLVFAKYLCFDIIATDDGYKILEINSHGQVNLLAPFYPFLENEYNRKVFLGENI